MTTLSQSRVETLQAKWKGFRKSWYKFSRDPLAVTGLVIVLLVIILAVFAPFIVPYPHHASSYVDFTNASQPPSWRHFCGTDIVGRDIFSRIFFGYRFSLILGVVVLSLAVLPGVIVGLLAGYFHGTWIETVCMRVTDIFLAIPPLALALAIAAILKPNLFNCMMVVSLAWWPWYARLIYGIASSLRNEYFVRAAKVAGATKRHILFREILPNCISPLFTKITLDMGYVIIIGSALSFVGLGVQPPKPGLGTMVADGARYLPDQWWMSVFPAVAIVIVVLGFNLLGDGLRDLLAIEEV